MSRTYEQLEPVISALDERIKTNLGAFPTDTAEGSIASFPDGADDIPLKSLVVNIDPVQSGSGDPSPDNVRPITGWTGVNVKRMGVNLWDEEWESGTLDVSIGKKVSSSVTMRSKNFIPVKPGMKCIAVGPYNVVNTNKFIIFYYDKDEVYVGYRTLTRPESFEVPSDGRIALMHFAYRYYLNDSGGVYNHDVSVNYPSTATAYAPYSSTTYPISFPSSAGTVYGGSLDVTNGVLTVDRAMKTFDGSSDVRWALQSINSYGIANFSISVPHYPEENYKSACNMLAPQDSQISNSNARTEGYFIHQNGSTVYIRISADRASTVDEWRAWLAQNNIQLVYSLATPIEIQLSPTEVKSLLGQNNIFADTGDTSAEYRADTKMYIERLTEPDADMIADANITSGSYFMVGNSLYLATANIASGGQVIVGTNCTQKSLATALNEINA